MNVAENFAEQIGGHEYHGGRLDEKDELHDAREDRVGKNLGNRRVLVGLRFAVLLLVGNVGDLLVTQHVEEFAQHKHGQYPDEREDEPNARIEVVGDERVARLVDQHEGDPVEHGYEHEVEGEYAGEQEDAVEYATLYDALIEFHVLLMHGFAGRRRR